MDQSFSPRNSSGSYPKFTSTRHFEAIKLILIPQSLDIQKSFFNFSMFTILLITKTVTVISFLFRKDKFFTHPIQIRKTLLEKLRFEKIIKKMLSSNNWNLWTNHFSQRTQTEAIQNLPLQDILKRLSQFYYRNRWTYKFIISFFNVCVFVNNKKRWQQEVFF